MSNHFKINITIPNGKQFSYHCGTEKEVRTYIEQHLPPGEYHLELEETDICPSPFSLANKLAFFAQLSCTRTDKETTIMSVHYVPTQPHWFPKKEDAGNIIIEITQLNFEPVQQMSPPRTPIHLTLPDPEKMPAIFLQAPGAPRASRKRHYNNDS